MAVYVPLTNAEFYTNSRRGSKSLGLSRRECQNCRKPKPANIPIPTDRYVRPFLAFKILLFTLLVPGTVLIYIPHWLLSDPVGNLQPANLTWALPAGFCIILGSAFYLRCAWDFAIEGLGTPAPIDPPQKLVVTGLYRRTRNPMFQGVLILLLAECLLFADPVLLVYAGSIALLFHIAVVFHEEPGLASRFGVSYSDYCRQVPRWGFALQAFSSDAG